MRTAIERFIEYLRVERNASPLTLKSYEEDLIALVLYLEEVEGRSVKPCEVTTLDLRRFIAELQQAGYAKATISRKLACLRSFFRFAVREGWVETNVAKPLRNPRTGRKLPHFLSAEEIAKLLESPPSSLASGLRDRAILETMYSSGYALVNWLDSVWRTSISLGASFGFVEKDVKKDYHRLDLMHKKL